MRSGSTARQRWARLRPEWARYLRGFQRGLWYPVLEEQPLGVEIPLLQDYISIEVHGRPRHVPERHFEVREEPSEGGGEEL